MAEVQSNLDEHSTRQRSTQSDIQADHNLGSQGEPQQQSTHLASLLGAAGLKARGNASAHAAAMTQAQSLHGNRAVQRFTQEHSTPGSVAVQRFKVGMMPGPEELGFDIQKGGLEREETPNLASPQYKGGGHDSRMRSRL